MKVSSKNVVLFGIIFSTLLSSCSSSMLGLSKWVERGRAGLEEKSTVVGDHTIVYLEGGNGEAVLLLHGFGADKDNWTRFAKYFDDEKYRVIAPDLPGFGQSSRIQEDHYDIPTQVERVHEFVEKLGLTKFHLAGNSMGGLIAGVYAATYPTELLSLALYDPAGVVDREPSELSQALAKGNNPLLVDSVADYDRLLSFVFVKPPYIPGSIKAHLAEQSVKYRDFNEKVFAEIELGGQLEKRMGDIHAKTLIVWGDKDRLIPVANAQVLKDGIKDSKVVIMKNCGHAPMIERPEEAAKDYLDFIQ